MLISTSSCICISLFQDSKRKKLQLCRCKTTTTTINEGRLWKWFLNWHQPQTYIVSTTHFIQLILLIWFGVFLFLSSFIPCDDVPCYRYYVTTYPLNGIRTKANKGTNAGECACKRERARTREGYSILIQVKFLMFTLWIGWALGTHWTGRECLAKCLVFHIFFSRWFGQR